MIKIIEKYKAVIVFTGLSVLILWQMLLPGYILSLDMVFTPQVKFSLGPDTILNSQPLFYLLKLLNMVLPGWVIQKIILFGLFFAIGYLAYKFMPVGKKYYANWWAAIFYTINPFVYERFLAGNWTHLFAYAFLPPLIHYLLKFYRERRAKDLAFTLVWLQLITIFSLHFLAMSLIIIVIFLVVNIFHNLGGGFSDDPSPLKGRYWFALKRIFTHNRNKEKDIKLLLNIYFSIGLFLILNSYWLVRFLTNNNAKNIAFFDQTHWEAFATAGHSGFATIFNILTLYGFWGEKYPWRNYFIWPQEHLNFWTIILALLSGLIITGIYRSLKDRRSRTKAIFFLSIGMCAVIFSAGAGDTIFKDLNIWMFQHVPLWSGFRDSQKWSGVLALCYSFFGAMGVVWFNRMIDKNNLGTRIKNYFGSPFQVYKLKIKNIVMVIIFLLPFLYTYVMLGGFARQLRPVWYPEAWQEINSIMNNDKSSGKALFLPWHEYMSFNFNQKLIIANPAALYFDREIIQSESMELGDIFNIHNDVYNAIQNVVINTKKISPEKATEILKSQNIRYIVYAHDLTGNDPYLYSFLQARALKRLYNKDDLTLFQIVLR